jgi:hypothetical protein
VQRRRVTLLIPGSLCRVQKIAGRPSGAKDLLAETIAPRVTPSRRGTLA